MADMPLATLDVRAMVRAHTLLVPYLIISGSRVEGKKGIVAREDTFLHNPGFPIRVGVSFFNGAIGPMDTGLDVWA